MSPQRTSKNGQFRSRWKRKGFGIIRLTYGLTISDHYKARRLLDELWNNDQLEVLRAVQKKPGDAGRVTIRELLGAKKSGRIKRDDVLVDLRLQRPLWTTLEQMIEDRRGGDRYKNRLRASLKKFAKSPAAGLLTTRAVVADLRTVNFTALRSHFAGGVDWNQFRKMIGVALSQLLESAEAKGSDHPFRKEIVKKMPKEPEPHHDVDIPVETFWAIVGKMPEHAQRGVVTLAASGMRLNTEYLSCGPTSKREDIPGVYCPGSKNADASGIIPIAKKLWKWVDGGIPAPVKERWLRIYFHRACCEVGIAQMIPDSRGRTITRGKHAGEPLLVYDGPTLHDLRHLALQLALDGGAQLNDVQSFARHTDPATTMRYLKRSGQRRAADAIGDQLLPDEPLEKEKEA